MGSVEVPRWLKRLPLAPEFRPSDTEFADPIAYISKIEKEASAFGICKIIPPLPKPSKRYVFHNLNKTLSKCPELGKGVGLSSVEGGEPRAVFTTRQQELGQDARRMKGVDRENQPLGGKKHVWQSGEVYTLEQFESKSKVFLRSVLGMIKEVNPLVIEALFWKAASEKPIYVEYANDVPGSGFAEPEGQFQYFRRRRRKRASYQSYRENRGNSDSTKMEMKSKHVSQDQHVKDGSTDHDVNPRPERSSSNASMSSPDGTTRSAKQRSTVLGNDMVGTAGWKLSNSPWNLQVIARSPGSLTRFMPDDIPGVTSPMVYIGMLFSWFAWHVEDHELHSLNFLHTGSPKTWYAVPGEHAQTFEETIRSEVYGGNVDRLAALTLLGEKTTLLSPEAIASSGIPCCRLVQNPGEFVVTFPRAYHVGFSHGFNCGEAANFGTPQWLEVAKDAAVRRAAMNYLPMLSHQQLMYLLTMSFVARVPRSLLPGVRCSRLRDRQREDRELSVKKAFLEDVLKENQILSCLLANNSAYYAVTWNADLLPCATRETQLPGMAAANVNLPTQDASRVPSDCSSDGEKRHLVQEMSLYMENLNGLYVEDDDDLSTDFQMDSGSLACVACGILGFPFMCVIQPSKRGSLKHLSLAQHPFKEDPGTTNSHAVSEDCAHLPHLSVPHMNFSTPQGWSTSCRFLRPRIFCLEHGTQIEQLLRSKGGANLLVICHTDYQKIKAHVSAIAEEISVPCDYHDGSMDIASQEELNLIDLAIDDNVRAECEDWTSVLGINLRYCVKIRKCSPSQHVQHALALGGLFSEDNARPHSCMKWKSKKSRSRVKLEQSTLIQSSEEYDAKREKVLPKESTLVCVKHEKKLIQYSRRNFKEKVSNVNMSSEACQGKQSMENLPGTCFNDLQKAFETSSVNTHSDDFGACVSTEMYASCSGGTKIKGKPQGANASKTETLFTASIEIISSVKEANDAPALEELMNTGNTEANHSSGVQDPMNVVGRNDENDPIPSMRSTLSFNETGERFTMHRESQVIEGKFTFTDDYHTIVSVRRSEVQAEDGDDPLNRVLGIAEPQSSHHCTSPRKQVDDLLPDESCRNNVIHPDILDAKVGRRLQTMQGSDSVQCASCTKIASDELAGSMAHQPAPVRGETSSGIQMESCAATNPSGGRTSENNMMLEVGGELENNDSKEVCAVACATSSGGDLCSTLTLDGEAQEEIQTRFKRTTELHLRDSAISMQSQSLPVSVIDCSDAQREYLADNCLSYGDTNAETNPRSDSAHGLVANEVPPTAVPTNEDLVSSSSYQMSEPIRSLVAEEDSYAVDLSTEGKEGCSSNQQDLDPKLSALKNRKRKREVEKMSKDSLDVSSFIRSPCEGLRPRAAKSTRSGELHVEEAAPETTPVKSKSKSYNLPVPRPMRHEMKNKSYKCDLEGCRMCFHTKTELSLHKRNQCPYEGCKKRFSSHKYAMVHQRVHEDDRPLKCPWKGCSMTFKWAWARKEHMRVHTGEKPYQCRVEGCGLSFRFVSDFSRHRRRTGHHSEAPASP